MSYLALFCFLVVSRARVHFCCAPLIVWLALVLCASSFVQKSLFDWHHSCCFIHIQCMSLDRSLWTRRISLIKPSLGHITKLNSFLLFRNRRPGKSIRTTLLREGHRVRPKKSRLLHNVLRRNKARVLQGFRIQSHKCQDRTRKCVWNETTCYGWSCRPQLWNR